MRVLIAPIEIAGQMATTARALRKLGLTAVSCNYNYKKNTYGYSCDINLGPDARNSIVARKISQLFFIFSTVFRFDVFHFNFSKSLLKKGRDIPLLRRLGKKMVMEFWGTDVRMAPTATSTIEEYQRKSRNEKKIKKISRLGHYIDVALVADLELKAYVEPYFKKVELVPQRIELDKFHPVYPDPARERPLIVHAPTNRAVKGTKYVLEAIEALRSRYRFDFCLIEGMRHSEAQKLYMNADIVVDQLIIGTYGVLAIESMALGKPVITCIREELRDSYPPSLPVVPANRESVGGALEKVLADGRLRNAIGIQSRKYVEDNHDSIKIAERLRSIYQDL
jgi:glycosyltransferase involved in cell wall biosynthesis